MLNSTAVHRLRIATRKSPLALWQARYIQQCLEVRLNIQSDLILLSTQGDEIQDQPLADVGGKGLFIKKLEQALLQGDADLAVHSMKDVPSILEPAFIIPAMMARTNVTDVLVTRQPISSLMDLAQGSKIGTSSYRRQAQLKKMRPDLDYYCIRGNVGTRLNRLASGDWAGIVLAQAGLARLNLTPDYFFEIPLDLCLPAPGQGALGIECLSTRSELVEILGNLNDPEVHLCVEVERAFTRALQGDCHSPIACYATLHQRILRLQGRVLAPDGSESVEGVEEGDRALGIKIGERLAEKLIERGARRLLEVSYHEVRSRLRF